MIRELNLALTVQKNSALPSFQYEQQIAFVYECFCKFLLSSGAEKSRIKMVAGEIVQKFIAKNIQVPTFSKENIKNSTENVKNEEGIER